MAYYPQTQTQTTQVVVTSQPTSYPSGVPKREWQTGLFDCFDDITKCLCVWCCTPFYQCYKMQEFDEHCCSAWPCCFGPIGSSLLLRYRLRHTENIQGTMMKDCCAATWCYPCMACQLFREHEKVTTARQTMGLQQQTIIQNQY